MFKKVLKILIVVGIMWIVSLLTIVREIKTNSIMSHRDKRLYDNELDKFRGKYGIHNDSKQSKFQAWSFMEPINTKLTDEEKLEAVIEYDSSPGINGKPVLLKENLRSNLRILVKRGWQDHSFNEFVSDLIPINRTLPDFRENFWCKRNKLQNLPEASIIIVFHNEAWSTLMRTIYSVLNRSPEKLLKEIILIDDFSTMSHLIDRLEETIKDLPKVRLIRTDSREGLIRARISGVHHATAPVVVYLDSHCECTEGWLEPLLDRIARDSRVIAAPVIDHIHENTFEYIPQNINDLKIGGFNWDLRFTWKAIPRKIQFKRKHIFAPIKTPTISGGLFAINKKHFEILGYYDEAYDIWGAENLELSFKAWMCGGSLEIVPCSRVGHVFRKRIPYEGLKGSLKRNSVRLAETWLDDYAKYFYQRIGNEKIDYGDITARKELRKNLNCKSFEWYLKNANYDVELPDTYAASGQIYSVNNNGLCLDSSSSLHNVQENVYLLPCHFQGGNQFWIYSKDGEIRRDDMCLDFIFETVLLFLCRDKTDSQIWLYDTKISYIRHMKTQKCLQGSKSVDGYKIILEKCKGSVSQKWVMENYFMEKLTPELQYHTKKQL